MFFSEYHVEISKKFFAVPDFVAYSFKRLQNTGWVTPGCVKVAPCSLAILNDQGYYFLKVAPVL